MGDAGHGVGHRPRVVLDEEGVVLPEQVDVRLDPVEPGATPMAQYSSTLVEISWVESSSRARQLKPTCAVRQ